LIKIVLQLQSFYEALIKAFTFVTCMYVSQIHGIILKRTII